MALILFILTISSSYAKSDAFNPNDKCHIVISESSPSGNSKEQHMSYKVLTKIQCEKIKKDLESMSNKSKVVKVSMQWTGN